MATRAKTAAPEPKIEVFGVRGLKNTPFRRTFATRAAYEAWANAQDANIEVLGYRESEAAR